MAAIISVTNGVDVEDQIHFNQYALAFNNIFGVTDYAQTNLGRLALPAVTSNPGSPAAGQVWLRTDLGDDGRLHIRKNSLDVPIIGIRQVVRSSTFTYDVSGTSYGDITGASVSITTTGGKLRVYLIGVSGWLVLTANAVAATSIYGDIKCLANALDLGETRLKIGGASSSLLEITIPVSSVKFEGSVPANTYTVKLQGLINASPVLLRLITGITMVVEELDE